MRLWPAMFGVRIVRTASSFSLLLLLAAFGWSIDYVKLKAELDAAKTTSAQAKVVASWDLSEDSDLNVAATYLDNTSSAEDVQESVDRIRDMLQLRVAAQLAVQPNGAKQAATSLKRNPLYRDPGVSEQSNWVDSAIRSIMKLVPEFNFRPKAPKMAPMVPGWLIPLMWGLLAAAVLTFGYFAFRHFSWKKRAKRRAKAVLEEDEPERTLDEWLALADRLTAEGRHREAVRALYLSCLLKFDEHGVARFLRGETNWEHLARIERSPRLPADLDFLSPTKAFDRIWYGHHVRGVSDVDQFRQWYGYVTEALKQVRAA